MSEVCHEGVVKKIVEDTLFVQIQTKSACASCSAKKMCNPLDQKDKIFEIKTKNAIEFNEGDNVILSVSEKDGMLAVFLSYIIPIILILSGIIGGIKCGFSEPISAAMGVGATALYYFILWFFRDKTANRVQFKVVKDENIS